MGSLPTYLLYHHHSPAHHLPPTLLPAPPYTSLTSLPAVGSFSCLLPTAESVPATCWLPSHHPYLFPSLHRFHHPTPLPPTCTHHCTPPHTFGLIFVVFVRFGFVSFLFGFAVRFLAFIYIWHHDHSSRHVVIISHIVTSHLHLHSLRRTYVLTSISAWHLHLLTTLFDLSFIRSHLGTSLTYPLIVGYLLHCCVGDTPSFYSVFTYICLCLSHPLVGDRWWLFNSGNFMGRDFTFASLHSRTYALIRSLILPVIHDIYIAVFMGGTRPSLSHTFYIPLLRDLHLILHLICVYLHTLYTPHLHFVTWSFITARHYHLHLLRWPLSSSFVRCYVVILRLLLLLFVVDFVICYSYDDVPILLRLLFISF